MPPDPGQGGTDARRTGRSGRPRPCLVEFTAIGRSMHNIEFPFLFAFLKKMDIPTSWVRLALDPAARYLQEEMGLDLDAQDREALAAHIAAQNPTHLVFSRAPAEGLIQHLCAARPDLRLGIANSEPSAGLSGPGCGLPSFERTRDLLAWLDVGTGVDRTPLFQAVQPDFGHLPLNAAAAADMPLGFIMAGAECGYHRDAANNPAYRGVDLSACRSRGCAFCASGGGQKPWPGPVSQRAMDQITAFHRTHPPVPSGRRSRLRLVGFQLLAEIDALASLLAARDLPASDLILDARTDHLLRLEPALRRAAACLDGTGHKLVIGLIGVENFSRSELERMNKGIAPWQNLAAVELIRRLIEEWPAALGWPDAGGLSTILFTPWTRPEDLLINLAIVRHFSLEGLCGKLLSSRLRLYKGLPMERLARRDGLIAGQGDDPAADTARRNFYPDDIPWRHADPRTEVISRIALRMNQSRELIDDKLYQRVQDWLGPASTARGQHEKLTAVIRQGVRADAPLDAEDLLSGLDKASEQQGENPRATAGPAHVDEILAGVDRTLHLQRAGLCRVHRLEALPRDLADQVRRRAEQEGMAVRLADQDPRFEADQTTDLLFGSSEEDVAELAELTGRLQHAPESTDLALIKERIGILLGYPACCARSFAQVDSASPCIYEWLFLLRRSQHAGPIDPLLNPFQSIAHVPCSFSCRASLALARSKREAVGEGRSPDLPAMAAHPVLFLLDRPGQWMELNPTSPVGTAFDFVAAGHQGSDPRLRALAQGGHLVQDEGLITVERRGVRLATFCLEAALFWHQAAMDPEFWALTADRALRPLSERSSSSTPSAQGKRARPDPPAPEARWADDLSTQLLARLPADRTVVGDWQVQAVESDPSGHLVIRLGPPRAPEALIVRVEPLRQAGPHYLTAGAWALSYSPETPPDSARHRSAIRRLAAVLLHLAGPADEPE